MYSLNYTKCKSCINVGLGESDWCGWLQLRLLASILGVLARLERVLALGNQLAQRDVHLLLREVVNAQTLHNTKEAASCDL